MIVVSFKAETMMIGELIEEINSPVPPVLLVALMVRVTTSPTLKVMPEKS